MMADAPPCSLLSMKLMMTDKNEKVLNQCEP